MFELLGWLGLLLLIGALMPFMLRILNLSKVVRLKFLKFHQFMALTALAVLTFHSYLVFNRIGFWKFFNHFRTDLFAGLIAWVVLLVICILASVERLRKFHYWLVSLLIIFLLLHIF